MNSLLDVQKHLGTSIIFTARMIVNKINNHFVRLGTNITFEQMGVLFYIVLKKDNQVIQQDIAGMMNKNKSAILRTIDILEKKEYVTRTSAPDDRRKKILSATQKGLDIVMEASKLVIDVEKKYTGGIADQDKKICENVLNLIRTACDEGIENPC